MLVENINKLRRLFDEYNIDAYLVNTNDEYLSEYTADYAKRLQFITGFTGSNGIVLITKENAYFFTDGRYIEQSNLELDKKLFQINDITSFKMFLIDNKHTLGNIGYDPKLFSHQFILALSTLYMQPIEDNLVDLVWYDKPEKPNTKIYLYREELAGKSHQDKITACRNVLVENIGNFISNDNKASALVIAKADSICWLLNLRASDIPYSPLLLGTVIITMQDTYLFTNLARVDDTIKQERPEIIFRSEEELMEVLKSLSDKVLIDYNNSNDFIVKLVANHVNFADPTLLMRARKNEMEIKCAKEIHIYDAVAVVEFLSYLSEIDIYQHTEFELAEMLTTFRQKQPNYIMDSFATICGFAGNGSIIHYHPTKNKSTRISGNGLLLLDSGGQYLGGTTDITRTIAIGNISDEEKNSYTRVLKGHIALANIKFPKGITGANLDVLARQYLWQEGKNYNHGTGHGVGSCLSVHEGPQAINQRNNITLEEGMIISNEPGYYVSNNFGIRIEGLMYVERSNYEGFLQFSQLTLVPFDKNLINVNLLNNDELAYIKKYYQNIKNSLMKFLSKSANKWLENQLLNYDKI